MWKLLETPNVHSTVQQSLEPTLGAFVFGVSEAFEVPSFVLGSTPMVPTEETRTAVGSHRLHPVNELAREYGQDEVSGRIPPHPVCKRA